MVYTHNNVTVFIANDRHLRLPTTAIIKYARLVFWLAIAGFILVGFWDMFFNGSRILTDIMVWSWNL